MKRQKLAGKDKIILVEPNPVNIPALKKCWERYSNVSIYQLGIVPKFQAGKPLPFYYTELDAPHYQVASFNAGHVLKAYPMLEFEDLKVIDVPTIDLYSFIEATTAGKHIKLLTLDIEGLDAEVILDTDFTKMDLDLLSVEYVHFGNKKSDVEQHLNGSGFHLVGSGVDCGGFDYLYRKGSAGFWGGRFWITARFWRRVSNFTRKYFSSAL
jgi:FkbM family methyltransferase